MRSIDHNKINKKTSSYNLKVYIYILGLYWNIFVWFTAKSSLLILYWPFMQPLAAVESCFNKNYKLGKTYVSKFLTPLEMNHSLMSIWIKKY